MKIQYSTTLSKVFKREDKLLRNLLEGGKQLFTLMNYAMISKRS